MPKTAPLVDLDAPKREAQFPDGIPVRHNATDFILPAELPADVLDPIVLLDLPAIFKKVLEAAEGKGDDEESLGQIVVDVLFDRPDLPADLLSALKGDEGVFAQLFGPEQWPKFRAGRPSIPDYVRLAKALIGLYGVSLGEAFGSPDSSESGGPTSSPTSSSTTESTPEASGSGRKKKGSSASGG